MIDNIGGRKVMVGLIILAVGLGAAWLKGDVPSGLLQLLQVLFGAYVLGNGVEHVANTVAARADAAAAPAPEATDIAPVVEALRQLQVQNAQTQQGVANVQKGISAIIGIATGNQPQQ